VELIDHENGFSLCIPSDDWNVGFGNRKQNERTNKASHKDLNFCVETFEHFWIVTFGLENQIPVSKNIADNMLIQWEEWAGSQMEAVTSISYFLFALMILITVWRVVNWTMSLVVTFLWPVVGLVLVMVRIFGFYADTPCQLLCSFPIVYVS
jgi:hypothetical protein